RAPWLVPRKWPSPWVGRNQNTFIGAPQAIFNSSERPPNSGAALEEGPWCYPRLYWECGQVGQLLYLEAEAAGLSGTGIGCY
ncbi:hypothetical protein, partial [Pseudomonas aeruginosa]|uniref:hypothetical protein n=1 Tax=Pseudomonas aeruginosa TaxID=287 RepID=UPI003993E9AE